MRPIVAFLAIVFTAGSCLAWSEGGHHLIAVMAFDLLNPEQQTAVLEVLKAHPRFEQDFKIPEKLHNPEQYLIGRAACWPDVATSQKEYHRPTWHYQLGAVLVIGDVANVPKNPGPCPADATLQTQELHIAQAIELCRRILKDRTQPAADRAIALCWISHLVGDSHQPCHSGSLYSNRFPKGDREANSIPTVQSRNLHSLWDGLLGLRFNAGDIRRRALEIKNNPELWASAHQGADEESELSPQTWLDESAKAARWYVYAGEVENRLQFQLFNGTAGNKPIDLSKQYLKTAAEMAQRRAAFAACRLAKILAEDIGP